MHVTPTATRRQLPYVLVGALLLALASWGLLVLLAQDRHISGIADRKTTFNWRTEPVILMYSPVGPTGRIVGWVGEMFIEVEGNLKLTTGGGLLDLQTSPNGLTGTVNGMSVTCQNLTVQSETGALILDDPALLDRIGTDFDFEIEQ